METAAPIGIQLSSWAEQLLTCHGRRWGRQVFLGGWFQTAKLAFVPVWINVGGSRQSSFPRIRCQFLFVLRRILITFWRQLQVVVCLRAWDWDVGIQTTAACRLRAQHWPALMSIRWLIRGTGNKRQRRQPALGLCLSVSVSVSVSLSLSLYIVCIDCQTTRQH